MQRTLLFVGEVPNHLRQRFDMPRLSSREQGFPGRRCSQPLHASIVAVGGPDDQPRVLELLRNLCNGGRTDLFDACKLSSVTPPEYATTASADASGPESFASWSAALRRRMSLTLARMRRSATSRD